MDQRIRIASPDLDPGRSKLAPNREKEGNFTFEEFYVGLEASPGS
jgi:hypothetical protein